MDDILLCYFRKATDDNSGRFKIGEYIESSKYWAIVNSEGRRINYILFNDEGIDNNTFCMQAGEENENRIKEIVDKSDGCLVLRRGPYKKGNTGNNYYDIQIEKDIKQVEALIVELCELTYYSRKNARLK